MSDPESTLPTTTADAIQRSRSARSELESLIGSISEEQLITPGPEGWSIKDHLAHLEVWSRGLHDLLDGKPRFLRYGLSRAEELRSVDIDVINDGLYRQNKDRSPGDVLNGFRESHEGTINRLLAMSDSDLLLPYSAYAHPTERHPDDHNPIVGWIAGNTWEHDAEHRGWIRDHFGV